jgi:hypothetical protein
MFTCSYDVIKRRSLFTCAAAELRYSSATGPRNQKFIVE